jgi:ferredoxin
LAELHGLSPAYSCRSGICHTCVCEVTNGEFEYLDEPLDEPDPGHVLICCAKPTTNLVLEV